MVRRRGYNENFASELPSPSQTTDSEEGENGVELSNHPLGENDFTDFDVSKQPKKSIWVKAYSVFHTVLAIFALFVTFKCNNGFNVMPFLGALCCPIFYLIYIAATKGFGFCLK